jgi:digeranylgeranylglycerophospholipid reductase
MPRYDVIVVGAGPGGCLAAFFLEHYSAGTLKVLLLERLDEHKYPRYHRMCGEGISRRAFKELRPLEPMAVTCEIGRAIEHWPGGRSFEIKAKGFIIDRSKLLTALMKRFQEMGGEVRQETVSGVLGRGNGYELKCLSGISYECAHLIGADGAYSVVRRDCFGTPPRFKIVADQYILDRATIPDALQFSFDERYGGAYRWEFPCGTLTRVGFPTGTDPTPENPLETHRRAIVYGGVGDIVKGRACLVGDAAAQINPLTFGGLRNSMVAGKMAAEALVSGDMQIYQGRWFASKHASPFFLDALVQLQGMKNPELMETVEHMGEAGTLLSSLGPYIKKKKFRNLYWAYMMTQSYGW